MKVARRRSKKTSSLVFFEDKENEFPQLPLSEGVKDALQDTDVKGFPHKENLERIYHLAHPVSMVISPWMFQLEARHHTTHDLDHQLQKLTIISS